MLIYSIRHWPRLVSALLSLMVAVVCLTAVAAQPSGRFEQALMLFRQKDYTEAAAALSAVVATEPGRVEARLWLGKSFINLGRFSEAEAELRRFTLERPANDEGCYLLAYTLFRQGRARESLAVYEQAANLKAPTADDLKIIGLNYGLLGNYDQAANYLTRAVAADPDNLEARYYLGRVWFTLNRFAEAIKEFRAVLQRDPQHVKAQNNLGQALEGQNDTAGALAAYRRAVELDSRSQKPGELPLLNLGALLLQKNEITEAISILTRAVAVNPASAQARFQLARAYLRQERLADAERELEAAVKLDPKDRGAHYQLGRLYHRLGKTEQARRELEISEQLGGKGKP